MLHIVLWAIFFQKKSLTKLAHTFKAVEHFPKSVSESAQCAMTDWIRYSFVLLCFKGNTKRPSSGWRQLCSVRRINVHGPSFWVYLILLILVFQNTCSALGTSSSTNSLGWTYLKFSSEMNISVEYKCFFSWKQSLNVGDYREKLLVALKRRQHFRKKKKKKRFYGIILLHLNLRASKLPYIPSRAISGYFSVLYFIK